MSNPSSSQTPEAQVRLSDADAQIQAESLEQNLEGIELNDPQPRTESHTPQGKKLSARDLLKRLERRRLEVTQICFTGNGTPAGKGSHGEVVIATLTSGDGTSRESANQIAVKKLILTSDIDEEKFLRTFANELHVLDGLDHPNLVKLVGFVEDMTNRDAWLVFPWEANGNVREFLQSGSGNWELPERVSLIKDVASGLEYLHCRQPPIRHGDLKSLNILVNSNQRAVITDFGSARTQSEALGFQTTGGSPRRQAASIDPVTLDDGCPEVTVSALNAQLTLTGPSWSFRWAAPEILKEEAPCLASDIWALGWIAWELVRLLLNKIVTDNYPFPEVKSTKLITVKVIKGLLPSVYDDVQLSQIGCLCDVMARCWKSEPKERLSAAECCRTLQWIPSSIPRTTGEGIPQIRSAALLLQMAEVHRLQGRFSEALKFCEEAFALAQSTEEKGTMAHALALSASSYQKLYDYDKAEEACNQSLAIFTAISDWLGRAEALRKLGGIHQERFNFAEAEEYFNEALAICIGTGYCLGQANVLQSLGEIHQERSNYAKAEEYFNQALAIFPMIGDRRGQANVLTRLGQVHLAQSNHAEAEDYFNQGLDIYTSIAHHLGLAHAFENLGDLHQVRSNYAKAEEFWNQALTIFTSMGDSIGGGNVFQRLGEIYQAQFNYAKAEEYFNQALILFTGIDDGFGQANALYGLGGIHHVRSNHSRAEESFNRALVIYTRLGKNFGRINSLVGLGEVLLHQARYSEAKPLLDDAAQLSNHINHKWAQDRSKELLAEIFQALNPSTKLPL